MWTEDADRYCAAGHLNLAPLLPFPFQEHFHSSPKHERRCVLCVELGGAAAGWAGSQQDLRFLSRFSACPAPRLSHPPPRTSSSSSRILLLIIYSNQRCFFNYRIEHKIHWQISIIINIMSNIIMITIIVVIGIVDTHHCRIVIYIGWSELTFKLQAVVFLQITAAASHSRPITLPKLIINAISSNDQFVTSSIQLFLVIIIIAVQ